MATENTGHYCSQESWHGEPDYHYQEEATPLAGPCAKNSRLGSTRVPTMVGARTTLNGFRIERTKGREGRIGLISQMQLTAEHV